MLLMSEMIRRIDITSNEILFVVNNIKEFTCVGITSTICLSFSYFLFLITHHTEFSSAGYNACKYLEYSNTCTIFRAKTSNV